MLKTGLILDYDPTINDIESSRQLELSPAGRQHLYWASGNYEYINSMMEVTPLLSEPVFAELTSDARTNMEWHKRTGKFVQYLLDEDSVYCLLPQHDAYQSQRKLRASLEALSSRLSNWTKRSPG